MDSLLFISQQVPWPKTTGGNIRTYHVLKALSRRFRISLIASLPTEECPQRSREALGELCDTVTLVPDPKARSPFFLARTLLTSLIQRVPALLQFNFNRLIEQEVGKALGSGRFRVVHINHIDTVTYIDNSWTGSRVIDTHNLLYQYYERRAALERNPLTRALYRHESEKLKHLELRSFKTADRVLVCSQREKDLLDAKDSDLNVHVIPNGVDCEFFAPSEFDPFDNPADLIFVGDMGYEPNHQAAMEFVHSTLPLIHGRMPEARLVIVGRNPRQGLLDLATNRTDVTVTGFVEDVRDFQRQARVYVAPLLVGSGTRLKILEAFAMGIPTVSTSLGAEGIDCQHGRDILIADGPSAMAEAVCTLLTDHQLYNRVREECRLTAKSKYDWEAITQGLLDLYEAL